MDDQLDELERADVDGRILQMIAQQPKGEEQQETLQEVEQAVYYRWWERLIDAALNGEDVSGWTAKRQRAQAGHNSSGPASDEEDVSDPRAKRQRVQAGHNSSGPPEWLDGHSHRLRR